MSSRQTHRGPPPPPPGLTLLGWASRFSGPPPWEAEIWSTSQPRSDGGGADMGAPGRQGRGGNTTCHVFRLLGDLDGVVGREDAPGSRAHVVGLVPVVLGLQLHQQRVVHLQLEFVFMSRHKPVPSEGPSGIHRLGPFNQTSVSPPCSGVGELHRHHWFNKHLHSIPCARDS